MNKEAQRIAIAELLPNVCHLDEEGEWRWNWPRTDFFNPLTDLNAMHEAAMTLQGYQRTEYCVHLRAIVMRDATVEMQNTDTGRVTDHAFYEASSAQRAEAFLKTIGKWVPNE